MQKENIIASIATHWTEKLLMIEVTEGNELDPEIQDAIEGFAALFYEELKGWCERGLSRKGLKLLVMKLYLPEKIADDFIDHFEEEGWFAAFPIPI